MNKVTNVEESKVFLNFLSERSDENYLLTKTCEELTELQEVLLKTANKIGPNKPSREHMIEEIGDVVLRLYTIKKRFGITTEDIHGRILYKTNRLIDYYNENEKRKNL